MEKMGYDPDQSKDNKRLVGLGSTSLRAQISEFDKKKPLTWDVQCGLAKKV